ncbi:MAG: restriction endonuclease subunit S [Acidimicrobiaceae bacterium]|nr:restriction endonuclease subunit S [Acidimicrobiaceae bacterium]
MKTAWVRTTLGEIAEIVSGATPKTSVGEYWGGGIPWVTPKELSGLEGSSIASTERTLTDAGLRSCAASLLPPQSVLLSSRAPIGLVAINDVPMATNQGFKSLVPDDDRVDAKFLYWWLRSHRARLEAMGNGATFKEVSKKVVDGVAIDLPPTEEQRRIGVVLDAAEALRLKRRRALAMFDDLAQAIFVDMFGDGSEWPTGVLGDHVPTTSGGTPSRSRPDYFRGHIPWVKSGELGVELVTATGEAITDQALANSSAKLMPVGTVLLAMYGATVGEAAVLGIEAATNQAVCCLSPTKSVSGAYLLGLLRSRKDDLICRAAGGAQPNISQAIIRGLEIPLAPILVQAKYAERIAAIDKLRSVASSSAAEIDTLFASLRQRAFRGEL